MWRRKRQRSIYQHVVEHIDPGTPGLREGGDRLPDDDQAFESGIRWAPGALEGAFSRYGGEPEDTEERATELHGALLRLAEDPGRGTRRDVTRLFREGADRALMDALLERLAAEPPRDAKHLHTELRSVLLETDSRDELKFAIALVGGFGQPQDADALRALARHEEFTLYAAVALASIVEDPVGEWLSLLPDVSGWGATELSELLIRAEDDRVARVLLRRGAAIGNALDLAVGCRLREALDADEVDDDLFEGAHSIIDDLTWSFSGPETLVDYPDAGPAVERFLELLDSRATTLEQLITAYELGRFLAPLTDAEPDDEALDPMDHAHELTEVGFDEARVERVRALVAAITDRPEWGPMVETALESDDESEQRRGIEAAQRLGLPLRDYLIRRIEERPNDSTLWFHLAYGGDAQRLGEVVRLAERVWDLDSLASGPALDLFGPPGENSPHEAADFVLQELPRFPGVGERLLLAALESPVIRHRLSALRSLSGWPRELFPPRVHDAIKTRLGDPDETVRAFAGAVLRDEAIPEPEVDFDGGMDEDV